MIRLLAFLPGLMLSALIGGLCLAACQWALHVGPSAAPAAALLVGMMLRSTLAPGFLPAFILASCGPGIEFARRQVLRGAVLLVGLQLSLHDLVAAGAWALLVDLLMVLSTVAAALWLGRLFRMDPSLAALIGVGAAVCGTSAVLAAQQSLGARSSHTSIAVGTVVGAGLVCLVLYPALWALNVRMQLFDAGGFGRFVGSTVHELAQVLAVTTGLGKSVSDTAVVVKMGRIALLGPTLLLLSLWKARASQPAAISHSSTADAQAQDTEPAMPLRRAVQATLALPALFSVALLLGLVWPLASGVKQGVAMATTTLLTAAMAGAGLSTRLASVREAGLRPLVLGAGLFVWLVLGGACINVLVGSVAT